MKEVTWDSIYRCNLACKHCYLQEENNGELTWEEEKKVLGELKELGYGRITFSGGEIFIKNNYKELLREAKKNGFEIGIITNGTKVDYDFMDEIQPIMVQVSIDGTKDFHNTFRGADCYDKCVSSVKELHKRGIPVAVNSTIVNGNRKMIPKLLEEIGEYIEAYRPSLLALSGRGKELKSEALKPDEVIELVKDCFELKEKYPNVDIVTPVSYVAQKAYLEGEIDDSIMARNAGGCPHYEEGFITIAPNGNVIPCVFSQDKPIGNVKEGISNVLERMRGKRDEMRRLHMSKMGCKSPESFNTCPSRVNDGKDMYTAGIDGKIFKMTAVKRV